MTRSISDLLEEAVRKMEDAVSEALCCATEAGRTDTESDAEKAVVADKAAYAAIDHLVALVRLEQAEKTVQAYLAERRRDGGSRRSPGMIIDSLLNEARAEAARLVGKEGA